MFTRFFCAALVFLSTSLTVRCTETPTTPSHPLDPKCPPGSKPGFIASPYQFDVPFTKVLPVVESFFDVDWYGGTVIATNGTDNVPGATRTSHLANVDFVEELVIYRRTEKELVYQVVYASGPSHLDYNSADFVSYTEDYSFSSICGGSATYINFVVTFCANPARTVYDFFLGFRLSATQRLATKFGARAFGGSCPTERG